MLIATPALLMAIYWGMVKVALPVLPQLSSYLHVSSRHIQQVFSYAFILSGIFPIIWGPVIDRVGVKKFSLAAGICFILVGIILALTANIYLFGVAFITACVLASAFVVIARTFPMLYFKERETIKRSLSFALFGGFLAAWLSPLISGYVAEYIHWKLIFYLLPILMFLSIWMIFLLPKPVVAVEKRHIFTSVQSIYHHLRLASFRRHVVLLACYAAFAQSVVVSIPFWLVEIYHLKSSMVAYLLLPMLVPGIFSPLLNKILSKFNTRFTLFLNLGLFLLAGIIAIILPFLGELSVWCWVLPGVLVNFNIAIAYPISGVLGYRDIKTQLNSASALISLAVYASGGVMIFISSFISIHSFYIYGMLILLTGIVASTCTCKEARELCQPVH